MPDRHGDAGNAERPSRIGARSARALDRLDELALLEMRVFDEIRSLQDGARVHALRLERSRQFLVVLRCSPLGDVAIDLVAMLVPALDRVVTRILRPRR